MNKFVYILACEEFDVVKIGLSQWGRRRVRGIADACPAPVKLIMLLQTPYAVALEAKLHEVFSSRRKHREWFRLSAAEISTYIQKERLLDRKDLGEWVRRRCLHCDGYHSRATSAKYCSRACKQAAYRKRLEELQ